MTRLKDIAQAAGVSIDTVSRVLNGKSLECWPSTAKKAERIREIARKLNYTPNRAAQMMRTKRSLQIGVIVSEVYNPITCSRLEMISNELSKRGYSLVLGLFPPHSPNIRKDVEKFMRSNLMDGILNLSPAVHPTDIQLIAPKIPCVTFNRTPQESPAVLDLREASILGMEYLWSLGHRKIAIVSASGLDKNTFYYERLSGYESFYASKQSACSESWIVLTSGWRSEEGVKAADAFLKTGCTACLAGNDLLAVGLSAGLKSKGYEIPKDFSLVSIDDTLLTSIHYPALTSLHEPTEILISISVDSLINKIEERPEKPTQIIPPRLIVRNSTAQISVMEEIADTSRLTASAVS